jgi:hypothetical protein
VSRVRIVAYGELYLYLERGQTICDNVVEIEGGGCIETHEDDHNIGMDVNEITL